MTHDRRRFRNDKGYRLHDRKIDYSGGVGSMRTIKYEVVDVGHKPSIVKNKAVKQKDDNTFMPLRDAIAEAAKHDHKWLYGNVNFNDYIENWNAENSKPEPEYSFLGFWLKALSLGFVFSNKAEEHFKKYLGIESATAELFTHMPDGYRECFDKDAWCAWFSADVRLKGKSEVQRKNILVKLAGKGKEVPEEIMQKWLSATESDPQQVNDKKWRKELFGIDGTGQLREEQLNPDVSLTKKISEEFGLENYKKPDWAWSADFPRDRLEGMADDRTRLTDNLVDYWATEICERGIKNKQATIFLSIGDNGNYLNNGILGNFFFICREIGMADGLRRQSLADLAAHDLCCRYGYDEEKQGRLTDTFLQLGEYARELPESPKVTARWADYRSDFNGTLESWYSNCFGKNGKQKIAVEQIEKLEGLLNDVRQVLDDSNSAGGAEKTEAASTLEAVLGLINENRHKQQDNQKLVSNSISDLKINNEFSTKLEDALAGLRRELNSYNQKCKVPAKGKKKSSDSIGIFDAELNKNKKDWQKELKKRIQLSPQFFGESAKQGFGKTIQLKKNVRKILHGLEKTVKEKYSVLDGAEIVRAQTVDRLAELHNRLDEVGADGNAEVIAVLKSLGDKLGAVFSQRTDNARFYLSGYERQKNIKRLEYTAAALSVRELIDIDALLNLYGKAADTPQKDYLLRDVAQLSKILTAALLYSVAKKEEQYSNTFAHSELSGYANLISKKEFIARYAIQATNGRQVKIAVVESKSKKGSPTVKYAYTFPHIAGGLDETFKVTPLKVQGKDGSITSENIVDIHSDKRFKPEFALEVRSSKYQTQFLDWFFSRTEESKGHRKKKTALEANGSFIIAEEEVALDWSQETPVTLPNVDGAMRLFVSQPFTIVPAVRKRDGKNAKRFIGVDIGEYALAYSVVEINSDGGQESAKVLAQGLIGAGAHEGEQKKLKRYVTEKRKSQVRATFSSPDTKIARIRESLVGAYRNQLQALAIKWNAALSFEFEVSAFESGSSRISKVYDSIKRADVYGMNKAEKADTKQAWGDILQKDGEATKNTQMLPWAVEATAAGTSQTCTKCRRWAGLAKANKEKGDDDAKKYYGTVRVLRENKLEFVQLNGSTTATWKDDDWKKFRSEIHAAMRPPLANSVGIQIVKDRISDGSLTITDATGKATTLEEFAGQRGNSSIYICPYTDCHHHIADADLQAAFNIALRGYIKNRDKKGMSKKECEKFSWTATYLIDEARKIKFSPVGFLAKKQEEELALR